LRDEKENDLVTRGLAEEVASESVRLDTESLRGCLETVRMKGFATPIKALGKLGKAWR
jgi:hypothetical protein